MSECVCLYMYCMGVKEKVCVRARFISASDTYYVYTYTEKNEKSVKYSCNSRTNQLILDLGRPQRTYIHMQILSKT